MSIIKKTISGAGKGSVQLPAKADAPGAKHEPFVWKQKTFDNVLCKVNGLILYYTPESTGSLEIYVNGILLRQEIDYTINDKVITFIEQVPPGYNIVISYKADPSKFEEPDHDIEYDNILLKVESDPTGVDIEIDKQDLYGNSNGTTPFERHFPCGCTQLIQVTAPATINSGLWGFVDWEFSGIQFSTNPVISLEQSDYTDKILKANYEEIISTYIGPFSSNTDTWVGFPANWDPTGVPTAKVIIPDATQVTIGGATEVRADEAELEIGSGSGVKILDAVSNDDVIDKGTITLEDSSYLTYRTNDNTILDADLVLNGDARIDGFESTIGGNRLRELNGSISGNGELELTFHKNKFIFGGTSPNTWTGGLKAVVGGTFEETGSGREIRLNKQFSLGSGDIEIGDPDVSTILQINEINAINPLANLKISNTTIELNENATVNEFWVDGTQQSIGSYNSSSPVITGPGTLNVLNGPLILFQEDFETPVVAVGYHQGITPVSWIRGSQGFNSNRHGIINLGSNQAYSQRYSTTGITTAPGEIETIDINNATYTVSIDFSEDPDTLVTDYKAYLLAISPLDTDRTDTRSTALDGLPNSAVLASVTGNAPVGGAVTTIQLTFLSNPITHASLSGFDLAIRFRTSSADIDNVIVIKS